MTVLDVGSEYINVDGNLVEKDALLIAEAIRDYDDNLCVICVDPNTSGINDAPFIIAERCPDGVLRRVFECWELNNSVLERIESSDTTRHDVQKHIEWMNAQRLKLSRQRYEEKRLLIQDIGVHALKNKKSSYSFRDPNANDQLVTIYDDRPTKRK